MSEETSKPKAETVGQIVVKARESRKMDRAALSRATHLNVDFLAAIEEGRWQDLPGDTYARGYIISLCAELGLQKHEMLEKYASEAHRDDLDSLANAAPAFRTREDELNEKNRAVPVPMLLLLACAALAVFGYFATQDETGEAAPAAAPEAAVEEEPSAEPDDSLINESLGAPDSSAPAADTAAATEAKADTARAPSLAAPSSASGAGTGISLPIQPIPVAKSRVNSRLDISCERDSAWIEIRSPGAETWASWIRQDGVRYTQTRSDTMYVRTGGTANLKLKLNHLKIEPKRAEFVIYGGQLVR